MGAQGLGSSRSLVIRGYLELRGAWNSGALGACGTLELRGLLESGALGAWNNWEDKFGFFVNSQMFNILNACSH